MNKICTFVIEKNNFLFMNEKQEFSARLKRALQDAGVSLRPVAVERAFNMRYWGHPVTVQAVRRWLRGEAIPAQDKLQVLSEWLQIEPQVLRFGDTPKFAVPIRRQRWEEAMNSSEREVLQAFLELPPEERKALRTLILALGAREWQKK
jgi:transcriptional regulator with XRE-family HTH domain